MTGAFTVRPPAQFRGGREYYHSTDLYEALVAALRGRGVQPSAFDLRIHDRIVTEPRLSFAPGEAVAEAGERAAATARFETSTGPWHARVVAGAVPITGRRPYDESVIWSLTRRDGDAFVAEDVPGVSPIEVVTAVAVHAHKVLLPPPPGARWLLAQIAGERMLESSETGFFRFELVRKVGKGTTQSAMCDRNGRFGKLLFVLK